MDALGEHLVSDSSAALQQGLHDSEPLVRLAALSAMERINPQDRIQLIFPLLTDPIRAVRLESTRLLAPVPLGVLPNETRKILKDAFDDYVHQQWSISDRPDSLVSLADFYRNRGNQQRSELIYKTAIQRYPWYTPAFLNLADLYRSIGRDKQGETVLLAALRTVTGLADIHYAYGLLLVRQQHYSEATRQLQKAAEQQPDNAHYSYVYALALQRTGDMSGAVSTLSAAHDKHPNDREILYALATMNRDRGDYIAAERYANALVKLSPADPGFRQLLRSLKSHK